MTKKKKTKSIWDSYNSKGLAHLPKMKNIGWKGNPNQNPKNVLQEYCQKFYYPLPEYRLIKSEGPTYEPIYTVAVIGEVEINHKVVSLYLTAEGSTIYLAEFKAAEKACDMLELKYRPIEI